MRKPANLIYGVDEAPSWPLSIVLGIQHICVASVAFIMPVVLVNEINGTPDQARTLICMAMIATGLGTIFQAIKRGPVGSGYLCPMLNGPAFLTASILAAKTGGLSLVFGMTTLGGIFEALFSRIVRYMRAVFPPEVTGTIVLMVGIEVVPLCVKRFLGLDALHPTADPTCVIVAFLTLLSMIGFNIWGKGKVRLFSVILGLAIGYVLSAAFGVLRADQMGEVSAAPWIAMPQLCRFGWSFDMAMLMPFLAAALSSALKTMGDVTTCQRVNDADWKRPDMKSIGNGIMACGLGNLASGILGAMGQSVSSANIGLSIATGATSRRIAVAMGILLIIIACLPKVAALFVVMPNPVMGAILIFSVSFMILAGMQIIMSRMIDARKTFVIGVSIIFGLSVDFSPEFFRGAHPWLAPLFSSSLSLSCLCAVFLNLLLRLGISKHASLTIEPGATTSDALFHFLDTQGSTWGARKEVIRKVEIATGELIEVLISDRHARDKITIELSFDEFRIDERIRYHGELLPSGGTAPTPDEILKDSEGLDRLAAFIARSAADSIRQEKKNDECIVHLHYEH